jgi:serine/threonine protein kinase
MACACVIFVIVIVLCSALSILLLAYSIWKMEAEARRIKCQPNVWPDLCSVILYSYPVGIALRDAHNLGVTHRDVKLGVSVLGVARLLLRHYTFRLPCRLVLLCSLAPLANVLMRNDKGDLVAVLTDFGFAQEAVSRSSSNMLTIVGTPGAMAQVRLRARKMVVCVHANVVLVYN